ncbi:MAG: NAD(P)-dependent glycerol-3-phosphate dehydrogenase [Cyclobacteriaceae bacterium]|nr:NAD(P)-dependent glycerol-3-phosphate dehydrogenase [Cyclobacteriaceae bacterium]MCH8515071.1 NAD(P)-dependent glycerol-3-phosphate dehydrogenase [Cyclobacteriaceae bacterium]
MSSKGTFKKAYGVVGAGSFGTAVANIIAQRHPVIMYARKPEVVESIQRERLSYGNRVHENVEPTGDLAYLIERCDVIFPVIPSANFRDLMRKMAPHLHPYHTLIHGTKGLDIRLPEGMQEADYTELDRAHVRTMSEVIREETVVVRVGCMAGPNLAKEILDQQPAATVLASHFDEVIDEGKKALRSDRFQVFGSQDLIGIELCGVLKNIIAIASGGLSGMNLGDNARSLLISRGMMEMIRLGTALGGNTQAFIGLAGVGDLVATASSKYSRNFTVGYRLAKGETLDQIIESMEEVAEGVNTVRIAVKLAKRYRVRIPITEAIYQVLYGGLSVEEALSYLMRYPMTPDVDVL